MTLFSSLRKDERANKKDATIEIINAIEICGYNSGQSIGG